MRLLAITTAGLLALSRLLAAQADVIRGRVTAVTASGEPPIFGASVVATSLSGNVSRRATTNSDGRYTITFPGGDGDYWITVSAIGYTVRRFELKRLADEGILIADARLFPFMMDTLTITATNRRLPARNDTTGRDVGGTERGVNPNLVPPDQAGALAAMAATVPGVTFIPGTNGDPSGFSVLGLSTDQNLTTLNGLASGASDLPRDAGISTSVATSPYDASQGGFSGGALNVRTLPGSNYLVQSLSAVGNAPALEWTDRAGRALGQEYTNLSLSGIVSGPISHDKAFYNFSYQLGRRSSDLNTLLDTDPLGLKTLGVSQDSVTRLLGILGTAGVPATARAVPSDRLSDQGSFLTSFDFAPPSSTSGQALNLTANGSWNRSAPMGSLTNQLPASSSSFTNWNGSARLRHTAYLGGVALSETGLSLSGGHRFASPYLSLPGGSVLVHSDFPDSTSGVQDIQFGGSPFRTDGTSASLDLTNSLSFFSTNNKHRVKLTSELRRDSWSLDQSNDLLGRFTFNSLADLEAGTPAMFMRQLAPVAARGSELIGALSLGDAWRVTPDVQIVYGARLDANHFSDRPALNPAVAPLFGTSNDHVPNGVAVSPRIGFSWVYGSGTQVGAFQGAARVPRGVIRGGIGVFRNTPGAQLPSQAMINTGLASGAQQITCIGANAPVPDWSGYAADPTLIPTACANGGGPVFTSGAPNVTLFDSAFAAQRSIRSTLNWSRPVLDNRLMASLTGTYSRNLNQAGSVDLNFDPTVRFTLPDEGGRPVFVQPSSIVAATGAVSTNGSRVSAAFNHVTSLRSSFRSISRQLQLQIAPLSLNSRLTWSLAYTLNSVRDRTSGFQSTAGSPLDVADARSGNDWRHQIQANLGLNLFDLVRVNWFQRFQSGSPFTPTVNGDINGDGYANDRAFIANPGSTPDTALAAGMSALLAGSSRGVRDCLRSQFGSVAGRNSCQGPWTSSGFLTIAFNPLKVRMPQRMSLSLQVANPLGAVDMALHGSSHLRGWGQAPAPDPRLLIVRGFDSTAQRYRYEVNQRFGSTSQSVTASRNPVSISVLFRIDLGPSRERQNLTQTLDRGRTLTGTKMPEPMLRGMYGNASIINPIGAILSQADSLHLNGAQADSLATLNRWYVIHLDSIWSPLIHGLAGLPDRYDHDAVYDQYRRAREASVDLLLVAAPGIRELLTPTQRRKLPDLIAAYLDRRYLTAIRSGTTGMPGGVFAPGASGGMGMGGAFGGGGNTVIIRN